MRRIYEVGPRKLSGEVVPSFADVLVRALLWFHRYQKAYKTATAGKKMAILIRSRQFNMFYT